MLVTAMMPPSLLRIIVTAAASTAAILPPLLLLGLGPVERTEAAKLLSRLAALRGRQRFEQPLGGQDTH